MSTLARETLERTTTPWLFAAALATTAPHALHQPAWLTAFAGLLFAWGAWLWWRNERLPGRWPLALLVALACGGILLEFRTLFGRDAGVAMLVVFMAMKLLELRSRRDATVVVTLAYFLLLTHYFYSQEIPTGLWLLAAMTIVTAALVRVHGGTASAPLPTLRLAATLMLQAVPFMLALFVLFPRINGPLWGLPQDAHAGRSGLSEQMTPGTISDLALSGEVALRARFDGPVPPRDKLYWRGPVLENTDGTSWRPQPGRGPAPQLEAISPPLPYETTIEPHNQRWLLALDAPVSLPADSGLFSTLTATAREPLTQRRRYALSAALDYRHNVDESVAVLRRNLLLPPGYHPQARALAQSWQEADPDPERLVKRALALFNEEPFVYTLSPPLLGQQPVDEFLFGTRRGFCEHYAAAFVVLMRAAGVPARVVTGYQGGETNPVDGFVVVRQSDAHAWAEVWLAGRGWVRVDPTAAVSPARIESGIAGALPEGSALPAVIQIRADWLRTLRFRWEALENSWNQHVLGYNPERQRAFLSRLGMTRPDWQSMGTALAVVCGTLLLALAAWSIHHRAPADEPMRLWRKALRRLAARQVHCAPWEPPFAIVRRLQQEAPDLAPAFAEVARAYLLARYGGSTDELKNLRAALARLP